MRTTSLLVFVNFLFIQGLWAQAPLEQSVSFDFEALTVEEVMLELEKQTSVTFFYQSSWIPDRLFSGRFENEPLGEVLEAVLKNSALSFTLFFDHTIIVAPYEVLGQQFSNEYFLTKARKQKGEVPDNASRIVLGNADSKKVDGIPLIRGAIVDQYNGEEVIGGTVYIRELNLAAVTDIEGEFELPAPLGVHEVELSSIGYEPLILEIEVFGDDQWLIELPPKTYAIEEVVVKESASDKNISSVQIGIEQLSPLEIKQLPTFLGEPDVIRSLLTLAGVNTVGEGTTGFNVRGGNVDQNLIMQDGAPIFNSSHVLGFFSTFNPDIIRQVSLYKGNVPAQYGSRISSVLDVEIKDADNEAFHLRGGLGLVSSKLAAEIPLVKGQTSLLLAGRTSYSDWIARRVKNIDVRQSSAYFYDTNAKLTHRFGDGSNISLSFYESFDRFRFSDQFGFAWKNRTAGFQWNQLIGEDISSNLSVSYGLLNNEQFIPGTTLGFNLFSGLEYYKVRENLFFTLQDRHQVHLGGEWKLYQISPEQIEPRGPESAVIPREVEKDRGQEFAFFINDEWELNDRISLSIGLRYSFFQQLGEELQYVYAEGTPRLERNIVDSIFYGKGEVVETYGGLEPRLSVRYRLDASSSVKLSYNRIFQYIHLLSNTVAPTPVDLWQVSTSYLPPQRADNFSIGYFKNFDDNLWETSAEAYFRSMENLIEPKGLAELLLNPTIETQLAVGRGTAFGLELSVKRKGEGWLTGQLSYTFSRSLRRVQGVFREETINEGQVFPANFDQPHSLKFNMNMALNKRQSFNVNFIFNSGRPVTAPLSNYQVGSFLIPNYTTRNDLRIPAYHRMDLSFTTRRNAIRKTRYKGSLTFAIYNVYFRRNPFTVFFRRGPNEKLEGFQLSVLGTAFPAITYNFEF
jgi:hypothetical protein